MKKIALFGIARSGIAAVRFFLQNGYKILAIDENKKSLKNLKNLFKDSDLLKNIEIISNYKKADLSNIKYLILSPGIPIKGKNTHPIVEIANKANCKIIGDIEAFYQFNKNKHFIGVTGTNGKSTTVSLIDHIFKQNNISSALGGNIGIACFDLEESQNYILEISSFQLDLSYKLKFNIAAILNITPDHLDRYESFDDYVKSKKRIFVNQNSNDFAILNIDDENCLKIYNELKNDPNHKSKIISISTKIKDSTIFITKDKLINKISAVEIDISKYQNLKADYQKQNFAFAYIISHLCKISDKNILKNIANFKGLKHRLELVRTVNNISFINDSKATNIESTICALEAYDDIFWIAGGILKSKNLDLAKKYSSKIKKAFLIGKDKKIFADFLDKINIEYHLLEDLDEAFEISTKLAKEEKTNINIILSPSCSSFDQWKNFEERGEYFCQLTNNFNYNE